MAMAKKVAMGSLALVLAVSGIMFILLPSSPGDPVDNNTSIVEDIEVTDQPEEPEIPDGSATYQGTVNISGITILPNNRVVLNERNFVDNHKNTLNDSSVSVTYQRGSDTIESRKFVNRIISKQEGAISSNTRYSDGSRTYKLEQLSEQREYSVNDSPIDRDVIHRGNLISTVLNSQELTSFEEMNNTNGYRIKLGSTENLEEMEAVLEQGDISSTQTTLEVDRNGIIRDMDLTAVGTDVLGFPSTSSHNYTVEKIGDVTVEEPLWVSEAEDRVSLITSNVNVSQNWIKIEHKGLAPVENSSEIEIVTGNDMTFNKTVNRQITKGDTLYMYPLSRTEWDYTINRKPGRSGFINLGSSEFAIEISKQTTSGENRVYYTDTLLT